MADIEKIKAFYSGLSDERLTDCIKDLIEFDKVGILPDCELKKLMSQYAKITDQSFGTVMQGVQYSILMEFAKRIRWI